MVSIDDFSDGNVLIGNILIWLFRWFFRWYLFWLVLFWLVIDMVFRMTQLCDTEICIHSCSGGTVLQIRVEMRNRLMDRAARFDARASAAVTQCGIRWGEVEVYIKIQVEQYLKSNICICFCFNKTIYEQAVCRLLWRLHSTQEAFELSNNQLLSKSSAKIRGPSQQLMMVTDFQSRNSASAVKASSSFWRVRWWWALSLIQGPARKKRWENVRGSSKFS